MTTGRHKRFLPSSTEQLCASPHLERPRRSPAISERFALWRLIRSRRGLTLRQGLALALRHARCPQPSRTLSPAWSRPKAPPWRCLKVTCRYHLAEFGTRYAAPGCVLLASSRGTLSDAAIASVVGLKLERVRQLLFTAERMLRWHKRAFADAIEVDCHNEPPTTTPSKIARMLADGGTYSTALIAERIGQTRDSAAVHLRAMNDRGEVVRHGNVNDREWSAS